mmetsp:Transcript_35114/g.88016  ORF Transcript_35114/g.88016 Transcript_35114/m.88016 type:complete len:206 (+) Transcript_35114:1211-1828(+)
MRLMPSATCLRRLVSCCSRADRALSSENNTLTVHTDCHTSPPSFIRPDASSTSCSRATPWPDAPDRPVPCRSAMSPRNRRPLASRDSGSPGCACWHSSWGSSAPLSASPAIVRETRRLAPSAVVALPNPSRAWKAARGKMRRCCASGPLPADSCSPAAPSRVIVTAASGSTRSEMALLRLRCSSDCFGAAASTSDRDSMYSAVAV